MRSRFNFASKLVLAAASAGWILLAASFANAGTELSGVNGPNVFMSHYFDVATSNSPSASGYGGGGASGGVGDGLVRIVNGGDVAPYQRGTLCAMI